MGVKIAAGNHLTQSQSVDTTNIWEDFKEQQKFYPQDFSVRWSFKPIWGGFMSCTESILTNSAVLGTEKSNMESSAKSFPRWLDNSPWNLDCPPASRSEYQSLGIPFPNLD